jgi:hypothetical protein
MLDIQQTSGAGAGAVAGMRAHGEAHRPEGTLNRKHTHITLTRLLRRRLAPRCKPETVILTLLTHANSEARKTH